MSDLFRKCTAMLVCLVMAGAASVFLFPSSAHAAPSQLKLNSLSGSTGESVLQLLKETFDRWTSLEYMIEGGSWDLEIGGESEGGRIHGWVRNPGGKLLWSRKYEDDSLRTNAHRFADDVVHALSERHGVASKKVVFLVEHPQGKDVYLCDADGKNLQRVTHGGLHVSPALSRDQRFLTYTSYENGNSEVILYDLHVGEKVALIRNPGLNSGAVFSPDGMHIALSVSTGGSPDLCVVTFETGDGWLVARSKGLEASPDWSPNGNQLVYSSNVNGLLQLYTVAAKGSEPKWIPTGYDWNADPSWSPDGQTIACTVRSAKGLSVALHHLKKGSTWLLETDGATNPTWGANGRHLMYIKKNQLYVHDTWTGEKNLVLQAPGKVSEPYWSK